MKMTELPFSGLVLLLQAHSVCEVECKVLTTYALSMFKQPVSTVKSTCGSWKFGGGGCGKRGQSK